MDGRPVPVPDGVVQEIRRRLADMTQVEPEDSLPYIFTELSRLEEKVNPKTHPALQHVL